ncbi:MAG TPA: NTP transferase domain-containing protein [Casimicrobiaceae bacterium]|jgi:choline kinase
MDNSLFQVIILAAGVGSRLGDLTARRSKALLDLGGVSLLERAIEFAARLGAHDIIIVGGYRIDQLRAAVAALRRPRIRLVENANYEAGNLLSVQAALPSVHGSFCLTNVDHVFSAAAARRVLSAIDDDITAFCEFERRLEPDEMKVVVDADGNLRRIAKGLGVFDGGYSGLTYVPRGHLGGYRAAVEQTGALKGDAAVAEQALQTLADTGARIRAASLDGVEWCEIDTPLDFRRAQEFVAAGAIR